MSKAAWHDPGWRGPPRQDKRPRGTRCPWAKLTEPDVAIIRNDKESTIAQLAARFGVAPSTIYGVKSGRTYSAR